MGWLDNKIRSVCDQVCGEMFSAQMMIRGVDHQGSGVIAPDAPGATTLDFGDTPTWDSNGFFNINQRSKITVPDGLDGRYFITVTLRWYPHSGVFKIAERDGGRFYAELATNANPAGYFPRTRCSAAPVVTSPKTIQHLLWEGPLAAGHFVQIRVRNSVHVKDDGGYSVNVMVNAWLTMRRLGAQA